MGLDIGVVGIAHGSLLIICTCLSSFDFKEKVRSAGSDKGILCRKEEGSSSGRREISPFEHKQFLQGNEWQYMSAASHLGAHWPQQAGAN